MQQVEPAVTLDVEDQVEFLWVFVWQEVTAFNSGSVQQYIDSTAALAHLLDDFGNAVRVREVDAEVIRRASCRAHCVYRTLRRLCPLQGRQFLLDQCRRSPFAARLDAFEEI